MSVVETMQIGKLITLEDAARRLADNDNGYFDLRWALRFCMESYVRLCIRIPHNITTWEREQEPDWGESCGKCGEVSDERELCIYEDAEEEDMPQYCDNCHMTKPQVMGAGDFIGQRWGVLFVQSSEVQALIYPKTEVVRCRVLYDLDDTWSGGYCRFEVASEYESMKDELDKEGFEGEDFSERLSQQSRENYLLIGLSDLLVWKEDFEAALQGEDAENSKSLPMSKDENKKLRNRGGDAKDFIGIGLKEYEQKHESKKPPLSLDILLRFAETSGAVQGYAIKEKGTLVYLHWDFYKETAGSVTKAKLAEWFKKLQPEAMQEWEKHNR